MSPSQAVSAWRPGNFGGFSTYQVYGRRWPDSHTPARHRSPRRRAGPPGAGSDRGNGIRVDDHGVGDQRDLVGGHAGALGLLAHLLGARALVDADGAELARLLLDHVGADPLDVVGHLLADLGRARGGRLELLGRAPEVTTANGVQVHGSSPC